MSNHLVNIKLHGILGRELKENWKLAVKSVSEAIHAINTLTRGKLYKCLMENDKKHIKYEVLINDRPFLYEEEPDIKKPESLYKNELIMNVENLTSIDIVPVLEGAEKVGLFIAGIILTALAIITQQYWAIPITLGLIASGVIMLLSPSPKFQDFREIQQGGKTSYLFDGPQNVTREGGPVPVGYGRMIVGSQVIGASYDVDFIGDITSLTV